MENLTEQEKTFLNMYLSAGQQASRQAELWKLSGGNPDLTEGSAAVYARRLLSTPQAKKFLAERKISSSTTAYELLEDLKEVKRMINERDIPKGEKLKDYYTEKRQILSDLQKCITVSPQLETEESKHVISDFCFTVDLGSVEDWKDEPEEIIDFIRVLGRNGSFIAMRGDNIVQISFSKQSGEGTEEINKAIEAGKFKVAVETESD